jgi:hypothetical protein
LFTFGLYTSITSGMITNDESWFLQVAHRVASGEVLYRDVFFGVTPLSAYLTAGLVRLFGVEILVVRGLMAACWAATALLTIRVARQLQLGLAIQVLLVMALLALVPSWLPGVGSPYTPLAYVFLLSTLSAVLSWREHVHSGLDRSSGKSTRSILFAGAWAGLAFASKQSIGLLAAVALWVAVLAALREFGFTARHLVSAGLASWSVLLVVALLPLVPVLASGGAEKFLEYSLLNRLAYIRAASISYVDGLQEMVRLLLHPKMPRDILYGYWYLQFLLPLAAFTTLTLSWLRSSRPDRILTGILIIFSTAAFAGAFPRADLPHVAPTVPLLLLALAWSSGRLLAPGSRQARVAAFGLAAILLGVGAIALFVRPLRWIAQGSHTVSTIPHLRGILVAPESIAWLAGDSQALQRIAGDQSVFFLTPSASLLYLAFGRVNPTPYDYPLTTAFGFHGQDKVIEAIKGGEIPWVCLTPLRPDPLAPAKLEGFVEDRMHPVENLGLCRLYQAAP